MTGILASALFITEQLLRFAPTAFIEFQKIVADKNVTADVIRAKRKALQSQKFEDLVPHSEIPPESDTPQAPV